jgi:nicotinate-nucleotide--dimethylbenzimidazole phosphoribosyltransferase
MFEQVFSSIKFLDKAAMDKCQVRLDNLTKPLDSLYSFEHLARKMAGISGNPRPCRLSSSCIILLNGSRRSKEMLEVFAGHVSAKIIIFDVDSDGGLNKADTVRIIEKGIKIAGSQEGTGLRVTGIGAFGTMSSSQASDICSWYRNGEDEPLDVLAATGNTELAGMVGAILGAAAGGSAVVLDDLATGVAALIASRMAPQVKDYLVGSHFAAEKHHTEVLRLLEIPAYLDLGMNVGEGVGAALGISLIQASLHILNDMKTFGEAEVHVAEDGPGALVQNREIRD